MTREQVLIKYNNLEKKLKERKKKYLSKWFPGQTVFLMESMNRNGEYFICEYPQLNNSKTLILTKKISDELNINPDIRVKLNEQIAI